MKERPIFNQDWEAVNLREDRPFREKTEEERQLEYFHRGEAIDMGYLLDINPSLKHYFAELLDEDVASTVKVETDGIERTLIQFNEEPRMDSNEPREWTESF